ncbi:MAG: FUSC family protein [Propioniciclava sp.]|uniref:FUSC family protein n=1 Tax=Propioniciclava sp. TaxID=2038686 RepID=UPI0039E4487E
MDAATPGATDPGDAREERRRWFDVRTWGALAFATALARQGVRRVRGALWPMLTAAFAASLAYLIAEQLLGRSVPMFAPIAAWVCLGFKVDRVPRKVAELGVGATVGVLIGELLAGWIHLGWWQMGVALMVGGVIGRFLDHGDLTTIQAGVNAVVVVGMSWWQAATGGFTGRWIDAVVGAGVAFVFAILLPRHPTERPRRYAAATLTELATLVTMVSKGLTTGDRQIMRDARGQARAVGNLSESWEETLVTARAVVRLNPSLWRQRGEVAELERVFRLAARARRVADMLVRQARGMTEEVGPMPELGALVRGVAQAAHALAVSVGQWRRPDEARAALLEIASRVAPAELAEEDWRPAALASVLRALVIDLLQITGLSREAAHDALTDTWGRPYGPHDAPVPPSESDDDASELWG